MSTPNFPSFGKYELIERLAMGGMAELFRAKLTGAAGFAKDVVIKRILPEMSDDPEFVRMFTNEAKIAARLNHPNIVQVMDFDCHDGSYYIAMEYVKGKDLRRVWEMSRKKLKPMPFHLSLAIVSQILRGLSYAHSFSDNGQPQHIVHRDISPHNVLLSFKGEVKVTDFGIARVVQHVSFTASGVIKGKLSYMAPEQTENSRVDHRADLFSVGVILWELLCRQRLFSGDNELQVLDKLLELEVPAPHSLDASIPVGLSDVVCKALSRNPEDRYSDARAFFNALKPFCRWDGLEMEEKLAEYLRSLYEKPKDKGTEMLNSWTPPPPGARDRVLPSSPFPVVKARPKEETATGTDPDPRPRPRPLAATPVPIHEISRVVQDNQWEAPTDENVLDSLTRDIRSPRHTPVPKTVQVPAASPKATVVEQESHSSDSAELATVEVNPRHYISKALLDGQQTPEDPLPSAETPKEQLSTTAMDPRQYLSAHQLNVPVEQKEKSNLTGLVIAALPPEAASPATTLPVVEGVSASEVEQKAAEQRRDTTASQPPFEDTGKATRPPVAQAEAVESTSGSGMMLWAVGGVGILLVGIFLWWLRS